MMLHKVTAVQPGMMVAWEITMKAASHGRKVWGGSERTRASDSCPLQARHRRGACSEVRQGSPCALQPTDWVTHRLLQQRLGHELGLGGAWPPGRVLLQAGADEGLEAGQVLGLLGECAPATGMQGASGGGGGVCGAVERKDEAVLHPK